MTELSDIVFTDNVLISTLVCIGGISADSLACVIRAELDRIQYCCPDITSNVITKILSNRALRQKQIFSTNAHTIFGSLILSYWKNSDKREFLAIQLSIPDSPILNCCFFQISRYIGSPEVQNYIRYKLNTLNLNVKNFFCVGDSSLSWLIDDKIILQLCYNEAIHKAFLDTFCRKLTPNDPCKLIRTKDYYDVFPVDGNFCLNTRIEIDHVFLEELVDIFMYLVNCVSDESVQVELTGRGRWDLVMSELESVIIHRQRDILSDLGEEEYKEKKMKIAEAREIIDIWNETRDVVEDISSNTVIEADVRLRRFLNFIRKLDNKWAKAYLANLKKRLQAVRKSEIVTLAYYLNGIVIPTTTDDILTYSTKEDMLNMATYIMRKMSLDNIYKRVQALENMNYLSDDIKCLQQLIGGLRVTAVEDYKVKSLSTTYFNRLCTSQSSDLLNNVFFVSPSNRSVKKSRLSSPVLPALCL